MNRYDLRTGQIVILDSTQTGRIPVQVVKINPKRIKVQTETGKIWNAPPSMLHEAPVGTSFEKHVPEGAASAGDLCTGMAVQFLNGGEPGLFVVIGRHGDGFRVTRLGGDNGRYYTGIRAENLEIVNLNIEAGVSP